NLSHELRTPISVIISFALAIKDSPNLPAGIAQQIAIIAANAEAELKLIDSVLELSQLMAKRLPLEVSRFDAVKAAKNTLKECESQATERNVELRYVGSDKSVMMEGDAKRISQIVRNLIDNSIKFSMP